MSQVYSKMDEIHFDLSILHTVLQKGLLKILKRFIKTLKRKI